MLPNHFSGTNCKLQFIHLSATSDREERLNTWALVSFLTVVLMILWQCIYLRNYSFSSQTRRFKVSWRFCTFQTVVLLSTKNLKNFITQACPVFAPKPGVVCLHDFAKTAMKDCKDRLTADEATLEHSQLVWKLMVALWGRLPDEDEQELDPSGYSFHKARREAFSQWLETGSWKRINREVQDSKFKDMGHIEAVFSLLTGHQISEACAAAQRSGDHRLALLLAQAGSTQEIKLLITKQLSDWHEMGVDKFIAPEYLQVYALLAGQLVWQSSHDSINTCQNLDWKRALAVHLWHACKPVASIQDALAEFDKGFQGESTLGRYCPIPHPPYMENNPEVYPEEVDMGCEEGETDGYMVWDMCYHLVKLYTDYTHKLARVLAPTTHTAYQLDYRLSWHVLQALQALGYSHISEQDLNHLHVSFASQLEGLGLWHWAVFVLLHIQDDCRWDSFGVSFTKGCNL